MPSRIKDYLRLMAAGLCLHTSVAAAQTVSENYNLMSRSMAGHQEVQLDKSQRQWIEHKRELILGTSAPDYPPFDLTISGHDYEGFTADYAGILGKTTGLPIKVLRFASREAAIEALESGRIDLLGTANGFEARNVDIVLSAPYAADQPVLVTREGETRSLTDGLAGLRLSMVYHYLPLEEVKAMYPGAIITSFPSYQNAINAVAFDQADVFLGDTISTHYMINKGYLNNIRMANFGKHEAHGFSFAVHKDNPQLLGIINAMLLAIPTSERDNIAKRWSAGSDMLLTDQKLQLTHKEERWLAQNPVVRVVVNEAFAPLTFFDSDGNFRGVTADLLELIRLRTGLRFDVRRSRSDEEMIQQISDNQADVIAALLPSAQRETTLNFTRPYLQNSFVLLTRKAADSPASLAQLEDKRLAIAQGNPLVDYLRSEFPRIKLIETPDTFSAVELLAEGKAEGAVNSLVIANYFISSQLFEHTLQISTTIGTRQAAFSLATSRDAKELNTILDKALLSIAPEELGIINSRWRGYSASSQSTWRNYHRLFYQVVIGAGVLLLISVAWNAYMRRQIKQRQAAERALNDQLEFMRSLVNGTPHPIYVRDRQGLLQSCNDSYLEAFCARREDVIGKSVMQASLSNAFEAREFQADYQRVVAEGNPLILDRALHIGERRLTIYHWILPYRDSSGEVQGIIGGWIDISERRQLFDDLREAKERADEANRAKTTFLATMSHEIRTPMNAVIGMLELTLKRIDHKHPDRPAIDVAYNSAKDLLELIGDILDIARIESGRLSLSPERVNPSEIVASVVRVFDGLARQKNLQLLLEFRPANPGFDVLLDPMRFKQVLSNLVSNAIKFTEHGQIRIIVDLQLTAEPERVRMLLQVHDSGIGISEQDQQRLFEPFAQADHAVQSARGGAGLGLMISRSLCEMMGGSLQLSSQPGAGTHVEVSLHLATLPLVQMPETAEAKIRTTATPLNVLVVDDHPANRLLMCQQLEFLGHRFSVAPDGQAGLQAWEAEPFDLVIADCNMPVMNGYELARAIRQHEQKTHRPACTVLGFTANAQPEEIQRCKQAGMDDCLFKPLTLTALSQWFEGIRPTVRDPAFSLQGLRLLTGGDPVLDQRLLTELLNSNRLDRQELLALSPSKEPQSFLDVAHKIKGAARIVQASRVIDSCEAMEKACHEVFHQDQVADCSKAIERAMLELEQALQQQIGQNDKGRMTEP
ncbi:MULTISPECIES: transporter substrate-binding domain-containing protein [unclassified Pseudomonas]|uniref:transporter substrate-binding domain-containing protein n=1 Tax=unclassified Pseudomonas TaxID=196821 RepID=UPI000C87D6DF|nr:MULTISPECIES: transporter substrate-binding domain-containing protein [unclassified Pseudomonas]PMU10865.1 hybrid sensor histidine kinase/response regulator [Pseudomonas sp. FW305-20]PMU20519.1 hybrid sensor histidine kinase/response regulator [Pseudomonas sp. FW305-122]PMU40036.1 hybrid sensor histidine kinase/response regulator [Pseudomonas sp. FW305-47B]PMX63452.1 hybrid sensor histidine kinase/response regulator [Pseudomonas sp. FW305-33]PMX66531.1 hybrid sensor histidine kinase/respons